MNDMRPGRRNRPHPRGLPPIQDLAFIFLCATGFAVAQDGSAGITREPADVLSTAKGLKLNIGVFQSRVDGEKHKSEIVRDMEERRR